MQCRYMLTEEGHKTAEECQGRAGLGPADHTRPPVSDEIPPVNARPAPGRAEKATTTRPRASKSKSNGAVGKASTLDVNKVKSRTGCSFVLFLLFFVFFLFALLAQLSSCR